MLGEIFHDDESYSGETGDSIFSLQYYRNKASEFQAVLNGVDMAAQSLLETMDTVAYFEDADLLDTLQLHLSDLEAKRGYFLAAAEALQLGASGLNAIGVRFPVVNMPQGLGAIPVAAMAGIAAAVAGAAALIVWGKAWIDGTLELQSQAQALAATTEGPARDAVAAQIIKTQAAKATANNTLGDIAQMVKYGALAALAFLAYRAYQSRG